MATHQFWELEIVGSSPAILIMQDDYDNCEGKKSHKWKKWRPYDSCEDEYRECKRCGTRQNREIELIKN